MISRLKPVVDYTKGTMESMILVRGEGFVQFSYFMYVTYCHLAVLNILYGLFKMVFDCL